jgi:hypothetical protein
LDERRIRAECAVLDVEDLIVEDFLDDVVIQIVLESIDEWHLGACLWCHLFLLSSKHC